MCKRRCDDACHFIWHSYLDMEHHMGEVVRFIPRSELERARLIREARAIYDSIFPAEGSASSPQASRFRAGVAAGASAARDRRERAGDLRDGD